MIMKTKIHKCKQEFFILRILNGYSIKECAKFFFFKALAKVTRGLFPNLSIYFRSMKYKYFIDRFKKEKNGVTYCDFKGALIPYLDCHKERIMCQALYGVFYESLSIHVFFNDNYDRNFLIQYDSLLGDGAYGYTDESIDVTVQKNDVVIDAGAWIGDFSSVCAALGAVCYAFEPTLYPFTFLQQTAELAGGKIIPINMGLGDCDNNLSFDLSDDGITNHPCDISNTFRKETVRITTIDNFVREQHLEKVDFIKSDIEGMERNLLMGARETLKRFAPKLAICTYHLPDDPEVLECIIKEANPAYRVVHLRKKLFAAIPG